MKKSKNKFLPLLSAIALFSGPALLVAACTTEITRYSASLSKDLQDRILFDFVGVNYSVDAKSQFSSAFQQGMEFIKKDVEGIMAQQAFYDFFREKLNYSEDEANTAFENIKDNLGLNLLASEYFNSVNNGEIFDNTVYKSKLIFQTDNWHQLGTTKFDYSNEHSWYSEKGHNPNEIFSSAFLYTDLGNTKEAKEKDEQIKLVAKRADEHYNEDIDELIKGNLKWGGVSTPNQLPPTLIDNDVASYQKSLQRFKWWLRFRYQQYYYSQILPQLNETLFTMANILSSILDISNNNNTPVIQIDNSDGASQLQNWGSNEIWNSNFRLVWDYTTNLKNAQRVDGDWAKNPLPSLITGDENNNPTGLNPQFLKTLASSSKEIKYTVDPILGLNAYISDTTGKGYDSAVKGSKEDNISNISDWRINNADGTHYWTNTGQGSFAYSAPIYWVDVVQNLDFNYYRFDRTPSSKPLIIEKDDKNYKDYWNNSHNRPISNSLFSKYIRGPQVTSINDPNYEYNQNMKWNTFWEMLYFLSSQASSNSNKDKAKDNFTAAAKVLFPKFIKKENIYNIDFWNAVKEYY